MRRRRRDKASVDLLIAIAFALLLRGCLKCDLSKINFYTIVSRQKGFCKCEFGFLG